MSYQSGLDYYKNINERYMKLVPKGKLMPPNPLLLMVSVDCDAYAAMLAIDKDWDGVARYIAKGVDRLVLAGAGCLVILTFNAFALTSTPRGEKKTLTIIAYFKQGLKNLPPSYLQARNEILTKCNSLLEAKKSSPFKS